MNQGFVFIRLRLLGDIVFTIPSLDRVRARIPGAFLAYVVEERFADLRFLFPMVDQWIVVPRKMGITEGLRFRRQLHHPIMTTLIDFHGGPKSALMSLFSGIPRRIGYDMTVRQWGYTERIPRFLGSEPVHSVCNQARLLIPLGIGAEIPHGFPYVPPPADAPRKLAAKIGTATTQRVVVHVGAGNRFRDWGADRFQALIARLAARGWQAVLIGDSPAERERGAWLAARQEGTIDLTGQLSIPELYALLNRGGVYFGADSGPLHLASLTPIPIVALFGPNLPEISGPWRKEKVIILQKKMSCRPCSQRSCVYDTINCLGEISVDEAYEAIVQIAG